MIDLILFQEVVKVISVVEVIMVLKVITVVEGIIVVQMIVLVEITLLHLLPILVCLLSPVGLNIFTEGSSQCEVADIFIEFVPK